MHVKSLINQNLGHTQRLFHDGSPCITDTAETKIIYVKTVKMMYSIKGTVSRDFQPSVYINQSPLGHWLMP
jgi:hypothetical protein